MDREWLEAQLAAGRSFEEIGREVGRDPSTVAYWAEQHGLESQHAAKHTARGGLPRALLEELIAEGLSTREIAERVGRSQTNLRYWLAQHQLSTRRHGPGRPIPGTHTERECPVHGWTRYTRYGDRDAFRCLKCRRQRVIERRRKVKEILVAEAGGCCVLCGYSRYAGALQFHHIDPATKEFGIALRGVARSLDRARAEVRKCVLLCANCHAEVEAGIANLPLLPDHPG